MALHKWSLLGLVSLTIRAATAQDCVPFSQSSLDYIFPDEGYVPLCLEPQERASSSFALDTLFPDGAELVFAIQTYSEDEILDLATDELIIGTPDRLNALGIWLEYGETSYDVSRNVITEFDVAFVSGLNGTSEGSGNGGCDGILGADCIESLTASLKEFLFESTFPVGRRPTQRANLNQAWNSMSAGDMEGCPSMGATFYNSQRIAIETESEEADNVYIFPSGNATWNYRTEENEETLQAVKDLTAFAIIYQWPFVDELEAGGFSDVPEESFFDKDDFNIRFACVRHTKDERTDDRDSNEGEGEEEDDTATGGNGAEDEEDSAPTGVRAGLMTMVLGLLTASALSLL